MTPEKEGVNSDDIMQDVHDIEEELASETPDERTEDKTKGKEGILLWTIGGILLVLVIIFAGPRITGYFNVQDELTVVPYNNFEFTYFDGLWYFEWQQDNKLFNIPLRFHPADVENVTVFGRLDNSFNRKHMYITFDPDSDDLTYVALGAAELSVNMVRVINVVPTAACTKNLTDACLDRPIRTCGKGESVLYLKTANTTRLLLSGECIILEGRGLELLRVIDRLLYKWYKIMP